MPRTEIGPSERLLEELKTWVLHETPTTDPVAVNGLMDKAEAGLHAVGAALQRIPGRDGYADNLIARIPGEGPPVVIAGHLDTVWDHGTLANSMPWRVEGDKFITKVDVAANPAMVGTEQVRFWRLQDGKLRITTAPLPNPNVAGSTMIGTLVWEKE